MLDPKTKRQNSATFPIPESALLARDEITGLIQDTVIDPPVLGAYECTLDKKGRFYLHASLRERYANGVMILRGREGTFFLLDSEQSHKLFSNLQQRASIDPEFRNRIPFIYRATGETKAMDTAKRIAIPAEFAKRWQIPSHGPVQVCGIGNCLELSTPQSWDRVLRRGTLWEQTSWDSELQVPEI